MWRGVKVFPSKTIILLYNFNLVCAYTLASFCAHNSHELHFCVKFFPLSLLTFAFEIIYIWDDISLFHRVHNIIKEAIRDSHADVLMIYYIYIFDGNWVNHFIVACTINIIPREAWNCCCTHWWVFFFNLHSLFTTHAPHKQHPEHISKISQWNSSIVSMYLSL